MTISVSREIASKVGAFDKTVKLEGGNCDLCGRSVHGYFGMLAANYLLRGENVQLKGSLDLFHDGGVYTDCLTPKASLLLKG